MASGDIFKDYTLLQLDSVEFEVATISSIDTFHFPSYVRIQESDAQSM